MTNLNDEPALPRPSFLEDLYRLLVASGKLTLLIFLMSKNGALATYYYILMGSCTGLVCYADYHNIKRPDRGLAEAQLKNLRVLSSTVIGLIWVTLPVAVILNVLGLIKGPWDVDER